MRKKKTCVPRTSAHGWPLPPKAKGNNVGQQILHFQHTGQTSRTITIPELPSSAEWYKTYSMYIYNATIWTVDYDATMHPIGDGLDTTASSGYSSEATEEGHGSREDGDDWFSMSFNHLDNSVSYVGRRLQHYRLCTERTDQDWARQLLPDVYMAQKKSSNPQHGGLIGDLPLLIGLMSLAVSVSEVSSFLPRVMTSPWRFSLSNSQSRGAGWFDGRGLVVKTYADIHTSSHRDLKRYESGHDGVILP